MIYTPATGVWAVVGPYPFLSLEPGGFPGADIDAAEPEAPYESEPGAVAMVRIKGVLTKEFSFYTWLTRGSSSEQLTARIKALTADPSVKAVVLAFDSPGGDIAGIYNLAEAVRECAKVKNVVAQIDDCCQSAAYWVASQARKIVCGPTAKVGQVGVYQVVVDSSSAAKKEGIEVLVFKSGELKATGVPGAPITDAQKADMLSVVVSIGDVFKQAVSSGRSLTEDQSQSLFDGGTYVGQSAVDAGLADSLGTLEQTLNELASNGQDAPAGGQNAGPTAKAVSAEAQASTPMKETLKTLFRALLGKNPEALTEAGLELSDVEKALDGIGEPAAVEKPASPTLTVATTDPEVTKRLDQLSAQNAAYTAQAVNSAAFAFADDLIGSGKAAPAQRDALKASFNLNAKADGYLLNADGSVCEGENLKALRESFKDAPSHGMFAEAIPGTKSTKMSVVFAGDTKGADPVMGANLLGQTDLGKRVLAMKDQGAK